MCHVVSHGTSDRRPGQRVVMCKMPTHRTDGRALEAATCLYPGAHGTQRKDERKNKKFGVH